MRQLPKTPKYLRTMRCLYSQSWQLWQIESNDQKFFATPLDKRKNLFLHPLNLGRPLTYSDRVDRSVNCKCRLQGLAMTILLSLNTAALWVSLGLPLGTRDHTGSSEGAYRLRTPDHTAPATQPQVFRDPQMTWTASLIETNNKCSYLSFVVIFCFYAAKAN